MLLELLSSAFVCVCAHAHVYIFIIFIITHVQWVHISTFGEKEFNSGVISQEPSILFF